MVFYGNESLVVSAGLQKFIEDKKSTLKFKMDSDVVLLGNFILFLRFFLNISSTTSVDAFNLSGSRFSHIICYIIINPG